MSRTPHAPLGLTQPLAIGAMRLSTDPARDDSASIATLHAAFDAGVTLVDTADAYAIDADDIGHNERLIAKALATWRGDRNGITVITKGGLTRPEGRWASNGRARHLTAACHASRQALGVERIALYQLHAPDPRVPWPTSIRALGGLRQEGVVEAIGLCNITRGQIEAARQIVEIAAVQVELNPWNDRHAASGVVPYCIEHDIPVLAYRPLGGIKGVRRVARDPVLRAVAAAHGASPFEVLLAWMRALTPHIIPLPGPTRVETARSCGRPRDLVLNASEREELDRSLPLGQWWRGPRIHQPPAAVVARATSVEIVMVMGLPGAGKTTTSARLVAEGYVRLNRDDAGGTLADIATELASRLDAGDTRLVLDNTYVTRASRAAAIQIATSRGCQVRGLWLETSLEDAQVNIVWRMLRAHGRLLTPEELRAGRQPTALSPSALFRAQREVEAPELAEGFAALDIVPFARQPDPSLTERAVIVWCDGVLRRSRSGAPRPRSVDDMETIVTHREVLARYREEGWRLLGVSWEPEVAEQGISPEEVEARLARISADLRLDIEFAYCPHGAGPPICWCRKPLPGLGVLLIDRYRLDPRQCIYLGASPQDPPFARRLGFKFNNAG